MVSIGIDISKGKSFAIEMDENGTIPLSPQEFEHKQEGLRTFIQVILTMPETPRVILENTGYYHLPVVLPLLDAGIFVSVINQLCVGVLAFRQYFHMQRSHLYAAICEMDTKKGIPHEREQGVLFLFNTFLFFLF